MTKYTIDLESITPTALLSRDLLTNGAHGCLERNFAVAAGLPCF